MDHERLERFEYFGGIDGMDSLSLLLVMVDQSRCHFVRADRLRCSFMSDRGSGVGFREVFYCRCSHASWLVLLVIYKRRSSSKSGTLKHLKK